MISAKAVGLLAADLMAVMGSTQTALRIVAVIRVIMIKQSGRKVPAKGKPIQNEQHSM